MDISVFVDESRPISDCSQSLLKSIARGHVKVNLASLSKSDLGQFFSNVVPGLTQIQRLSLTISSSAGQGRNRKLINNPNTPEYSLAQHAELVKGLSVRVAGSKVEAVLKQFLMSLSTSALSLMTLIFSLPLPPALFNLLSHSVAALPSLLHLSLQGSQAGDTRVQELCSLLQQANTSVTHLDLSGCCLNDSSAASVAALLKTGTLKFCMERFKKFLRQYPDSSLAPRIRNMLFEKRTAALTAELRSSCPGLVVIALDYNQVTDVGALALFEAAIASSTIETICLRANQLTMRAGRAARAVMIEHGTLRAVDMRDNCALKLGLLREDHIQAFKNSTKSAAGALGDTSPVKKSARTPAPELLGKTVTDSTGASAAQAGCRSDGGACIRPFRPTHRPAATTAASEHALTDDCAAHGATAQEPPGAEWTGADDVSAYIEQNDELRTSAMETVLDVLEDMYADKDCVQSSKTDAAAVQRMRQDCSHSGRSSPPERWSERCESPCCGAAGEAADVQCSVARVGGGLGEGIGTGLPPCQSELLSPAAVPFTGRSGSLAPQERGQGHDGEAPGWKQSTHSSSGTRGSPWKAGVFSQRQGCTHVRAATGGASAACPMRAGESDIMGLRSWRKQLAPGTVSSRHSAGVGKARSASRGRNGIAGRSEAPWSGQPPLAVKKVRKKARKVAKRSGKRAVNNVVEGRACRPGLTDPVVVADAAAVSASLRTGVGKSLLRSRLAARTGSQEPSRERKMQRSQRTGVAKSRLPKQKAMAASLTEGTAGGVSETRSVRSMRQPSQANTQMPHHACVVTQQRGPETAVKDFCAQVDVSAAPDGTCTSDLVPSQQDSVATGFVSMHDVCTWERRRQKKHTAGAASSTSGASTACEWGPEEISDYSHRDGPISEEGGNQGSEDVMWPSVSICADPSTREGEELQTMAGGVGDGHDAKDRLHTSPVLSETHQSDDQGGSWTPWGFVEARACSAVHVRRSRTGAETLAALPRRELTESPQRARASCSDATAGYREGRAAARDAALAQRTALCVAQRMWGSKRGGAEEGCKGSGPCNGGGEQSAEHHAEQEPPLDLSRFADAEDSDNGTCCVA